MRLDIAQFNWRVVMWIATLSMLLQQAFSYVCQMVLPILADRIAEDFGISRGWLGLYLFIQNLMAIAAALGCGGFILRYGPLRVSQAAMLLMAISLLVVSSGIIWLYPIGAILLGASAVSTPASSHILANVVPARLAPLIFSVKQTGVPVGSLIGGLLVPFLIGVVIYSATFGTTIRFGAYGAAFGTALCVIAVAIMLQPLREYFDRDRRPEIKISFADPLTNIRIVVDNPPLRDLAFGAFAFGGLQSIFAGFFILYLVDGLDYSETEAGAIFAIASFSAIWARILWGALGGSWVSVRWIMAGIGLGGAAAAILVAQFDATSSAFFITAVAVLYNISALSWHGVLLAETARLAPEDKVGPVTGAVLSFTSVAMMIYPAIYGIILAQTGSYRVGYIAAAIPSLLAFLLFAYPPVDITIRGAISALSARLFTYRALRQAAMTIGLGMAGSWLVINFA